MKTNTKAAALNRLTDAGYKAELTKTGLRVTGPDWSVEFSDKGQDFDQRSGNVPSRVDELSCWDAPTTRKAAR